MKIFEGVISEAKEIQNSNVEGLNILIHTDKDVTVAFEQPSNKIWTPAENLKAPGGPVRCPSSSFRITPTSPTYIRVVLYHR